MSSDTVSVKKIKKLNPDKILGELGGDLDSIKEIKFSDRGLESIETLEGLVNLRKLDLSNNKLVRVI